jgi:hypothetical protein
MGIIQSGILSGVSGKVAGVVGGRWKDKYYLRAYVKPANPNTAAQQVQRTKFQDCVNFAKSLVGQVFNAYTDTFIRSMSGFNFFIRHNIDVFDGSPDYPALVITSGPLSKITVTGAVYSSTVITISYGANIGNNGSNDDKVFAIAFHVPTKRWYFCAAETLRNSATITVEVPASLNATDFETWTWAIQYTGTTVTMLSVSDPQTGESP